MGLTKREITQVAVLLFGCLLSELNYTLLAPALPVIMGELNVGETDVQWLMPVYALVEAVVIPLNAFFLGRFSTRKLFVGVAVLSVVVAATGAACLRNHEGFERTDFDIPSVVLSTAGMIGFLYGVSTVTETDAPWASALYMAEAFGWQMVATPTNTWGINSLPNEVMQHGTAVLDTLMQVGAAFGTATIVSLTALAPGIDGYRFGFIGCAVLLGAVAVMVLTSIRDR